MCGVTDHGVVNDARETVVEVDRPDGLRCGTREGEVGEGLGVEFCPLGPESGQGGRGGGIGGCWHCARRAIERVKEAVMGEYMSRNVYG